MEFMVADEIFLHDYKGHVWFVKLWYSGKDAGRPTIGDAGLKIR